MLYVQMKLNFVFILHVQSALGSREYHEILNYTSSHYNWMRTLGVSMIFRKFGTTISETYMKYD